MGMFDELSCLYPLPAEGADGVEWQTKSLDCTLDMFEIRADGTLWHEEYQIKDQSDPNATGLLRWVGSLARVNQRMVPYLYTGEVAFHGHRDGEWFEFSAYFVSGDLTELHLIEQHPLGYLAALAKLASEATPGPWTVGRVNWRGKIKDRWGVFGPPRISRFPIATTPPLVAELDHMYGTGDEPVMEDDKRDAAFIAAADPQTILALIRDLRQARIVMDEMRLFARHSSECAYSPTYPDGPEATCDCGFDAALRVYEVAIADTQDEY
jgi:hypothetical protein